MNILITAGATREPIDKVRFITNMSTGRTGAALADALFEMQHEITYLHGEGAILPKSKVEKFEFKNFCDLDHKIKHLLKEKIFDVVIHAAAVSDYSIENITQHGEFIAQDGKVDSAAPLELKLTPNYKILNRIKDYSEGKEPLVIGFKLTYSNNSNVREQAIEKIFDQGSVDLIVHNDLLEVEEKKEHVFHIHNSFHKVGSYCGPIELATKLNNLIAEAL